MNQIAAPEILWRIFTLVESNADLARAARLNKFIGNAALDVLWNDITFGAFVSLFPIETRAEIFWENRYQRERMVTEIIAPISPKHWRCVNVYARRVRTLRRSRTVPDMQRTLTSLKLYDRGSETPFIFPKLQCLIWDGIVDIEEMPLVANLLFCPTLKELCFGCSPHEISTPSHQLQLLVPLNILSDGHFSALTKLHLQVPLAAGSSGDSFNNYHTAMIDLLSQFPNWQLRNVSMLLTKDIIHLLAGFTNLRALELYDCATDPSNLGTPEIEQTVSFQRLESLAIRDVRSLATLTHLEHYHCIPSRSIRVSFLTIPGTLLIDQRMGFYQMVHLISQKATVELLEVEGSFNLTDFLESLLALPNIKELYLGPGINLDINDDTLELMSIKWKNLTHLSIYRNDSTLVSIRGIVSLHRCPIQFLRLSFILKQADIDDLRRRMNPVWSQNKVTPLRSLQKLYLTSESGFYSDGDLVGTVLALTYLFPNAELMSVSANIPDTQPVTPQAQIVQPIPFEDVEEDVISLRSVRRVQHSLHEILQIRNIVRELLSSPDFVHLIQAST